jgi:hypothetical protein
MNPTTFYAEETHNSPPREIAERLLDPRRTRRFGRQMVAPGVAAAEFEQRTADVVGTRIRVTRKDGSSYVEEIIEWEPETHVAMEVKDFSESMASAGYRFKESWDFERIGDKTKVCRSLTALEQS